MGDVIFFFSFKLSKCSTSDSKGEEPKETKKQVSFHGGKVRVSCFPYLMS